MINASYNYKEKFYLTDQKLNSKKLMNTATNIETLVWRLSNTKVNNIILIKTNNADGLKMNLSFERLFGKLINNQENMARIISSQEGRMIQSAAKKIVSTIFLPIGF
jgi:recombinational DNA repair protein RecR